MALFSFRSKIADSFGIGQNNTNRSIINAIILHQLISEQDWNGVERILDRATKKSRYLTRLTIKDNLILHFACQFDAPLRIVTKLSTIDPSSHIDSKGRYPIHFAVASGCDPDVIEFLIRTNPSSAGAQDQAGRTPMHYAGKSYSESYGHFHFDSPMDHIDEVCHSTLLVVKLLAKAAIHTVNVEDEDDMNPIAYALLSATNNIEIITLMQFASKRDWNRRNAKKPDSGGTLQGRSAISTLEERLQSFEGIFIDIEPVFTQRHKRGSATARTD